MIYNKVVALCEQNKISIAALEKKAEIGNGTIRNWNGTNKPSYRNLEKVAIALNVDVRDLLD